MVKPWAKAGYKCWCIDTQHSIRKQRKEGNIIYQWGDVRTWCPPDIARNRITMIFAFPPCTHVAISGARDYRIKGTAMLRDSLEMFAACEHAAKWSGAPYMIENPVGKFSDHMNKPDYTFQPWQYGENYSKLTCLWTGNGFVMPTPQIKKKPCTVRQKIIELPPSKDRRDLRSVTPMGFAKAVFKANAKHNRAKPIIIKRKMI
jgi:hypothetical protein